VSIEREVGISGDGKVINGERVQDLCRLEFGRTRSGCTELCKTIRDEKDEDDEESVCGALYFEIAEEGVGSEERKSFVDDILR